MMKRMVSGRRPWSTTPSTRVPGQSFPKPEKGPQFPPGLGEWTVKRISNPAYKGVWEAKKMANPEFVDDDNLYFVIILAIWLLHFETLYKSKNPPCEGVQFVY